MVHEELYLSNYIGGASFIYGHDLCDEILDFELIL